MKMLRWVKALCLNALQTVSKPVKHVSGKTFALRTFYYAALFLSFSTVCAQPGKDGAKLVPSGTIMVNSSTTLSANATAGSTYITVANSAVNAFSRFPGPLAQGDLIMIIQHQGATITSTNDSTWGSIAAYNNCGLYEFSEVASVPNGTTINLTCALKNNYTATGKVQVVRVPRYTTLTINSGGILSADNWDGTTGGIIAVEIRDSTVVKSGGSINASGKGSRGGGTANVTGGANINYTYVSLDVNQGGSKGEGIAGYNNDYNIYGGRYCRGAGANGGGGGNTWDSPGGGGANAGDINAWTGNGNPDTTVSSWISAWNLEAGGKFATSTSSGGGRGGYSVSSNGYDPLVYGPDNPVWSSYYLRSNTGGKGGRPLDYSTGRIFFGGGGGSGHFDNNCGGAGGSGGGIVYLVSYGTVSGGGTITSNGNNGLNANCGSGAGDPGGGAGAGGTVILSSTGAISGISITANGGKGGDQIISTTETEGAGGGGGGGYIAISNGNIARMAGGGKNGITTSSSMVKFPPDGATIGGVGLPNQTIVTVPFSSLVANAGVDTSICKGQYAQLSATGGLKYSWLPVTGLSCDTCAGTTANPSGTTIYVVTVSSGACSGTDSVVVTVLGSLGHAGLLTGNDTICRFMNDTLFVKGSVGQVQWQSSPDGVVFSDIAFNDTINYLASLTQTTYYRTYAGTGGCGDTSAPVKIVVNALPQVPQLIAADTIFCSGDSTHVCSTTGYASYSWNTGSIDSCTMVNSAGGYWLTVTDVNGCSAQSGHQNINVYPVPSVSIVVQGDTLYSLNAVSYQWFRNDTSLTGAVSPVFIAPVAGDYAVAIIDSNGCRALSNNTHVSISTGIPSISPNTLWSIYPDPFDNIIYIHGLVAAGIEHLEIYDITGRAILSRDNIAGSSGVLGFDVSNLVSGIYYINIRVAGMNYVQPLVKQ